MSTYETGRKIFRRSVGPLILALSIAACNSPSHETKALSNQQPNAGTLPRCFSKPLPGRYIPESQPDQTIIIQFANGNTEGDPGKLPANVAAHVEQNTVEITDNVGNKTFEGTGFTTLDSNGNPVVVTAAHVVDKSQVGSIKVIAENGEVSSVDGGCFVFEYNGQMIAPGSTDKFVDTDVAVLRLRKPLGNSALSLSTDEPFRSRWGFIFGYQNTLQAPQNKPAEYTGMVIEPSTSKTGLTFLTGLHLLPPSKLAPSIADNMRVDGGASGGPIVNSRGNIIGMTFAGMRRPKLADGSIGREEFANATYLLSEYSVNIPRNYQIGYNTGLLPTIDHATSVEVISQALRYPEKK